MITDEHLDTLLAGHRRNQQVGPDALAAVRSRVLDAAAGGGNGPVGVGVGVWQEQPPPQPRRKRVWTRAILAAAAVVVLVAGATLVPSLLSRGASSEASSLLELAASRTQEDVVPQPGEYLLITHHGWHLAWVDGDEHFYESYRRTWEPSDYTAEWMLQNSSGKATALDGTPIAVAPYTETYRAACGGFFKPEDPCNREGDWAIPTPEFMATLSRDPGELFDQLDAAAPENSWGDAELLVYAADLLRSGQVPADLRSALYLALRYVPGLEVTEELANLDGRTGVALGMVDPSGIRRQDIIVDPDTGAYIGEREVLLRAEADLPAGLVYSHTSVSYAIVDEMGEIPAQ